MNKNKKILIVVITILLVTIGVTFAYFMAKTGDGASANANVKTGSVDDLKFSVSNDLSIVANQFNFAQGQGNLESSATARASLKANNTKNTATYNYYVYFYVVGNEYTYTSDSAEILLSVIGPNGEITNLGSLNYVSVTSADGTLVKGFDITSTSNKVFTIANNYEITSDSSTNYTNQDWTFKVTFVNLDSDQTRNEGKTMTAKIVIQKDKIAESLADVASNGDNFVDSIKLFYNKSLTGTSKLYYLDGSLKNSINDVSYRYIGRFPNNYVCFGSDEDTCPADNLYRIIGVFDGKVKLVKADYATSSLLGTDGDYTGTYTQRSKRIGILSNTNIDTYYWNYNNDVSLNSGTGSNTWSTSLLNKINLNTNFFNNIGSKWSDMIATTTWNVGGYSRFDFLFSLPKNAYQYEIVSPASSLTYDAKIGLLYVTDYAFSAEPYAWTYNLANYASNSGIPLDDWMYVALDEWTITPVSNYSNNLFNIKALGNISDSTANNKYVVRPVFYLLPSIKFLSGKGTESKPYRIGV